MIYCSKNKLNARIKIGFKLATTMYIFLSLLILDQLFSTKLCRLRNLDLNANNKSCLHPG